MKGTAVSVLLLAFAGACASTPVLADDLLGLYIGGAFGESHVRTAKDITGDTDFNYEFDERHSAWKVTAGIRPLSPLGVELEYMDFGNANGLSSVGTLGGLSQTDQRALALFAVGYLPMPVPFLDVYAKLGVARLRTAITEIPPSPEVAGAACGGNTGLPCGTGPFVAPQPSTFSGWTTNIAYGLGVQGKMGALAIRAEFQGIGSNGGNPDLLSLGVTWTF